VATEIQDMISALKLLDNPQQDIPLAALLRSPMVGLNESQLTALRLHSPNSPYHMAVRNYCQDGDNDGLRKKLDNFYGQLNRWRSLARCGRLADLVWTIYRETNLPAYVMGLPDGRQRHSNLLHLHDTARQFDAFSGLGLSRFLRFVEKLRDQEGDFGPAPVLTEADDVVRIMSIHKSKGLEFPVVFVTHLSNQFNKRDTKGAVLFDRPGGCPVGLRVIDKNSRDSWATLAHNVIADNINRRQMAEEMRILYVALTRARERLILTASIGLEKMEEKWRLWRKSYDTSLPDFQLDAAGSAIDWISAALAGHPDMGVFFDHIERIPDHWHGDITDETSRFKLVTYTGKEVADLIDEIQLRKPRQTEQVKMEAITGGTDTKTTSPEIQKTIDRLDWQYPHHALTKLGARAGVTELKRRLTESYPDFQADAMVPMDAEEMDPTSPEAASQDIADFPLMAYAESTPSIAEPFTRRPGFLTKTAETPTAAEIGIWTHLLLEKLDLDGELDLSGLTRQLEALTAAGFFTGPQAEVINLNAIENFFTSKPGQDLLTHKQTLHREWTFTLAVPASEVHPAASLPEADRNEPVIIRGVIDALYENSEGMVIVDYKTDSISKAQLQERGDSYQIQMGFYGRAVKEILKKDIAKQWLYFLKPGLAFDVPVR
ncbi:MAG: PD-(D/E)XK nuclease family protein, partial [Phycisphaerae bacterium]|nr:PD-(D/E)XK nuclease family protein [Phycisphaerae bacterium]